MRLFKDGRGLLRRVRWARVALVAVAIHGVVAWRARRDDEAAAIGALKTISSSWSGRYVFDVPVPGGLLLLGK